MPWRHGGYGGIAPPFLTLALDGGEWSASCPSCFTPGEITPSNNLIWVWVGPRVGLDAAEKRQMLPLSGIEAQPYTTHTPSLYRLPVLQCGRSNGSECGSLSGAETGHEAWCQTWSQMQEVSHVPGLQQLWSYNKHSTIAILQRTEILLCSILYAVWGTVVIHVS
jgi:hypothetical protein